MDEDSGWGSLLTRVPERVDTTAFWGRVALVVALAAWGLMLIAMDHRTGAIGQSFLHRPLLVFHEAGHVVFRIFGEWVGVLGGTLGQLLMPAVIGGVFLLRQRDPFGAAAATWLLGVSVLDVAPYVYDALEPQLMLLGGRTGEDGGPHDWIYLLDSLGMRSRAHALGGLCRFLGALTVLAATAWMALLLWRQRARLAGDVLHED